MVLDQGAVSFCPMPLVELGRGGLLGGRSVRFGRKLTGLRRKLGHTGGPGCSRLDYVARDAGCQALLLPAEVSFLRKTAEDSGFAKRGNPVRLGLVC